VRVSDETETALTDSISSILALDQNTYIDICQKIACFNQQHTWEYQIHRFLTWLETGTPSGIV